RVAELRARLLFFFQAEDGIRDRNVTGVQTCALPILFARNFSCPGTRSSSRTCSPDSAPPPSPASSSPPTRAGRPNRAITGTRSRSEERRVGKEWRAGGPRDDARNEKGRLVSRNRDAT